MMKRLFSIILAMLITLTCTSVVCSAEKVTPAINKADKNADSVAVSGVISYEEEDSYETYLANHKGVADGTASTVIDYNNIVNKNAKIENGAKYPVTDGKNYKNVVYTGETDSVTFKFKIAQEGMYNIILDYHTVEGKDISIVRSLSINGKIPFENAKQCTFTRRFVDSYETDKNGNSTFKKDYLGNDIRPDQKEAFCWQSSYVVDYLGYYTEPLEFYFKKGVNTITLESVKEPVVIGKIEIVPIVTYKSYNDYVSAYSSAKQYSGEEMFIEAEYATYKSDKTLYPSADVSTCSTSANGKNTDAYIQSVNMTGGTNWQYMQQAITWTVGSDVKEGLYALNFKYRQRTNDGMRSPRILYVNGKVPFEEAKALGFNYTDDWALYGPQTEDGKQCLVYLKPGDTITLESTLSEMGGFLNTTNTTLTKINSIYRQIIKITGAEPDQYRDYQLDQLIPQEIKKLKECADSLQGIIDGIKDYTGESSSGLATLDTLVRQMNKMSDNPGCINTQLSYFKTNVGSLGTWLNTASYVPLEIDYISLSAPKSETKSPTSGFFKNCLYSINRFISSFVVDYNAIGNDHEIKKEDENTITVWMATGRDQWQILRQLINNSYTSETGNQVNLELVNAGALLSAVVAGIGPDVVLDQVSTEPVNFALRNAIYDLKNFKNDKGTQGSNWDLSYEDTLAQFYPEALKPFYFDRKGLGRDEDIGLYALPEKQEFQVMFYRTDVLAAEGISIPKTWTELISTITALNKKNLEFGMPAATGSFFTMLKQMGGEMYKSDYKSTDLQTDAATKAFKQWTNYYVNYGLALTYNFQNRFRTGEMPLAIDSFILYNTLAVSAPEINGRWGYTIIPGTQRKDENGNTYIDHSSTLSNNCAFILSDNINYELSWKFLKWWVSTNTQSSFGNQLECVLGPSARYNTANMDAFEQLPWTVSEKAVLNEQLSWGVALPQIAGSYFLDRHINNAFRKVVYKEKDAKDTLYDYSNIINSEITKKRQEFGLPVNLEE